MGGYKAGAYSAGSYNVEGYTAHATNSKQTLHDTSQMLLEFGADLMLANIASGTLSRSGFSVTDGGSALHRPFFDICTHCVC